MEFEEFEPIKKNEEENSDNNKENDKKKTPILYIIIFVILIIITIVVAYIIINRNSGFKLNLLGDKEVTIKVGEEYNDKGCEVLDKNGFISIDKPLTSINLDNNIPGTYRMTCSYKNKSRTRYIHVVGNDSSDGFDIYDEKGNPLSKTSNDIYYEETTMFKISMDKDIDYIKYCIVSYGDKCTPEKTAKSQDEFVIHSRGRKTIYVEKYKDDNKTLDVRYVNIK